MGELGNVAPMGCNPGCTLFYKWFYDQMTEPTMTGPFTPSLLFPMTPVKLSSSKKTYHLFSYDFHCQITMARCTFFLSSGLPFVTVAIEGLIPGFNQNVTKGRIWKLVSFYDAMSLSSFLYVYIDLMKYSLED